MVKKTPPPSDACMTFSPANSTIWNYLIRKWQEKLATLILQTTMFNNFSATVFQMMMATVMLNVVVLFVLFTEKQETFWSYFDEGRYFCPFTVRILAALMLFFSPTNFFEASWLSTEKKLWSQEFFRRRMKAMLLHTVPLIWRNIPNYCDCKISVANSLITNQDGQSWQHFKKRTCVRFFFLFEEDMMLFFIFHVLFHSVVQ